MNAMKRQARLDVAKYATYGVFAALGVSEIMAAETGLEATLALLDMGVFGTDIVINETLATRLNQTADGKAFLNAYNKFALIYGGARVYGELTGLIQNLRAEGRILTNPNDILGETETTQISNAIKAVEAKAGVAAEVITIDIAKVSPLLKTESNQSFFWSGRTNDIGGEKVALTVAKSKGGITLEGLLEEKGIKMPAWEDNKQAWEDVSAAYANQVSGEVRAVVGQQLREGNVWENIELPRLKNNPNVSKITIIDPETLAERVIFKR
ncbi:hypothetical protein [Spirosoma linguale]|uniref:Uncharacterized protein n=1 Tax=Spirosoma linguale (strain ATCC 33905 / DSM 74 / LMG 10896 / Claus 1) TaxID=504472 RepID=D2QKW1_SPILD|nr:hypothetical protein Slin_4295 [Spirosoma linguale DSM 74]